MPETIGQRLKQGREYRHLTLEKAAEVTRIRLQYLQALEADDFSALPSPVQARGFLRNYADYLGLDLEQIIAELRNAASPPESAQGVVFDGAVSQPVPSETVAPLLEAQNLKAEKTAQPSSRRGGRKKPSGEEKNLPVSVPESEMVLPPQDASPAADEAAVSAETRPTERGETAFVAAMRAMWGRLAGRLSRQKQPLETEAASPESEAEVTPGPAPAGIFPAKYPKDERPLSSREIFEDIGQQLRQRREVLGLSLGEIERHIRLRAQFLAALEEGWMETLPSPVQTRGMLSVYATFLDLDADALLLRFADALQAQHRERYPEKAAMQRIPPVVPHSLPRWRMLIAGDLILGASLFVLLVVFVVWGVSRVLSIRSERAAAQATAPSISEVLIGTPQEIVVASATPIPVEDTPLPALEETLEIPTAEQVANVQVNIVAVERTYLRVLVDGKVAFDGRTTPGALYPFEAEGNIDILAGNAAALRVIYNQRDLGLLGGFGQLAHYVYTIDEILVPTPAASLTPTLTPFVTPTPSVTPSPTPSPTIPPAGDTL
ncbi:MAG: hypothetical protein Fur0043_15250 [Anaerolineales bacterium]